MMERLRESKWLYVLMSVVLASMFWLYIRAELDPTQENWFYNIPVEITGESVLIRQGLTVAMLSEDEVDLRVQAPASVMDALLRNRKDLAVTVDVSKCNAGENQLAFVPNWPTNVNVEDVVTLDRDPAMITVTVEKLYTQTFDVEFQLRGKVKDGYQAGTAAISPETVAVNGSVEQVSRVDKVVAILEDDNLDERFAGDLPLKLLDSSGKVLEDIEVTMDVQSAYVVLPVVVVKEIPLTVNFIPGGGATLDDITYKIEPDTIVVSGAEADMESLTELSLGSVELAKVVGSNTIPMSITLDPALENVSGVAFANVTVTINDLPTRAFEVDNIKLENVPRGYTAISATEIRTVVVRGKAEELDKIDASQLRIVADMSEIAAVGSYPVPVRVYLDANSAVGVIGEYSIMVNVSK